MKCYPMPSLTFVTKNLNKVDNAQKLLTGWDIDHVEFDVPEIQSLDPREVIEYKLQYAFERVGKPCFVMDDSLFFDCLNGFPGPFIKWYYEKTVGPEKTCKIANLFQEYGARWISSAGYFDGKNTTFFQEEVVGTIPTEPRGTNGFSWDPIFIPEGESITFAEMTFEQKHQHTATGKLLRRLGEFLEG
jgi:XTP/dITP diphosphohydrolase